MNKIEITKIYTFEAAHQLPGHKGKCARLHGHSYKLEVTVAGPLQTTGSSKGMVMDFFDISEVVKREIINEWDHQFLNDLIETETTVENLATHAFEKLKSAKLPVAKVRLWETANSYATVRGD